VFSFKMPDSICSAEEKMRSERETEVKKWTEIKEVVGEIRGG